MRPLTCLRASSSSREVNVVEQIPFAYTGLELTDCGPNQVFWPDVCKEDEHAVPRNRKGSFLVVGDWGWDHLVHGNVPEADCQAARPSFDALSLKEAIGKVMVQKMEELGDVTWPSIGPLMSFESGHGFRTNVTWSMVHR